jgi:hypothetical protein
MEHMRWKQCAQDIINIHSCDDCRRIKFRISDPHSAGFLSFPYQDVLKYAGDGCDFFARAVSKLGFRYIPSSLGKNLELHISLGWIDNGPMFHCVYISWMHARKEFFGEDVSEEFHAFTPEGKSSLSITYFNLNELLLESPLAPYIPTRPCEPLVFPLKTKTDVKHWLHDCQTNHSRCKGVIGTLPFTEGPKRLVALGSETVHLEETDITLLRDYVALSYCWGDHKPTWCTTRQNFNRYLERIEYYTLPQTIKDAMYIARELGYEYLWVDALCIIQEGNENDKKSELRKMAGIYCGASVVLSAARARCSKEGFLQDRKLDEIYTTTFELYALVEGVGTYTFFLHEYSTDDSKDEPIDKRGWTLQERSLAVRLLRFGSKQTRWECLQEGPNIDGGCDCRETSIDPIAFTGELSQRLLEDRKKIPNEWKFDNWMKVVQEYSSRQVSRISDRLQALAALAQMFAIEAQGDSENYCAGLWRDDIPMQLLWRRVNLGYCAKAESPINEDSEDSNPSWSWASVSGRIEHYPHPPVDRRRFTLGNIECRIVLKDQSLPYGEVQSAKLILDGYLREVHWDGHALYDPSLDATAGAFCSLVLRLVLDQPSQSFQGPVWLLHIYSNPALNDAYGLILERVKDSSGFKRIGYFGTNLNSQEQGSFLDIPFVVARRFFLDWLQLHEKQRITIL